MTTYIIAIYGALSLGMFLGFMLCAKPERTAGAKAFQEQYDI